MRVLIAGGFGFVGGRIAQHLQLCGHQVVLGGRNVSFSPPWLPKAEVAITIWHDTYALAKICSGVDVVIQAAGMNAKDCDSDPVAALAFNGLASARLVAAAAQAGVKRFIYLSTAHVYASPLIGTITEDICPRNLHPYATSHVAGENAVLSASQRGEMRGTVLRLSNAFGAPTHPEANCWMLLINDLCRQAVQKGCLRLKSSGLQSRDFLTLKEVGRAVLHLSEIDSEHIGTGIFNVGSGAASTVLEIVDLIQARCKKILGFTPKVILPEPKANELSHKLHFDINKLLSTGFILNPNIAEEIDMTLRLCKTSFGGMQ